MNEYFDPYDHCGQFDDQQAEQDIAAEAEFHDNVLTAMERIAKRLRELNPERMNEQTDKCIERTCKWLESTYWCCPGPIEAAILLAFNLLMCDLRRVWFGSFPNKQEMSALDIVADALHIELTEVFGEFDDFAKCEEPV